MIWQRFAKPPVQRRAGHERSSRSLTAKLPTFTGGRRWSKVEAGALKEFIFRAKSRW